MNITRNEKYSDWEHKSFEHVQNFCAGLPVVTRMKSTLYELIGIG